MTYQPIAHTHDDEGEHASPPSRPGKRTVTSLMAPRPRTSAPRLPSGARELDLAVHRRSDVDVDEGVMQEAAARGLATPTAPLPFADAIQRSFGRHDVRGIPAHVGAEAAATAGEMHAEAYATGGHVILPPGASLHTVAHEVAHTFQERSGVARKSSAPGDDLERHADAVADRVVAGQSAEDLISGYCGIGALHAAPIGVHRKISYGKTGFLPKDWTKIPKGPARKAAEAAFEAAKAELDNPDDDKLAAMWTNLVNDAKDFDLESDEKPIVAQLVKRYRMSVGAAARGDQSKTIADALIAEDDDLTLKGAGGRKPQVTSKDPATAAFDPTMSLAKREQRHASTVLHEHTGKKGEEVQASIANDGSEMLVSTNKNTVNNKLAKDVKDVDGLRSVAAQVAMDNGLASMSHEEAMADRVVRHAMKLYARIDQLLGADAKVTVPKKSTVDGRHAEIRIEQSGKWAAATHHHPAGTKLPCMACMLYFIANGHKIDAYMGPMWCTGAALSTQIEDKAAGQKLGSIDADDLDSIAALVVTQYKAAVAQNVQLALSPGPDGKLQDVTNADSDSELEEEEEFPAIQSAMMHDVTPGIDPKVNHASPDADDKGKGAAKKKKKRKLSVSADDAQT